jgi:hypothetical protein
LLSGNRLSPTMFGRQIIDISNGTLSKNVEVMAVNNDARRFTTGQKIGLNDQLQFLIANNGALNFRISDARTDAGQNLVPYFDANHATFDTVAPISSFGLVHYTTNTGYAGYIRPVITSSRIVLFNVD